MNHCSNLNSGMKARKEWTSLHLLLEAQAPNLCFLQALQKFFWAWGAVVRKKSYLPLKTLLGASTHWPIQGLIWIYAFRPGIISCLMPRGDRTDISDMSVTVLNNLFLFYLPNIVVRFNQKFSYNIFQPYSSPPRMPPRFSPKTVTKIVF